MALSLVKSDKLDVMLTSYETFRTNFNDINVIDWCCMIFDEVISRQKIIVKAGSDQIS